MARSTKKKSSSTKSSKRVVTVDFSKDTAEGGRRRFKEGDYKVEFVSHKFGKSKEKETPFVQLGLKFTEGKYKGTVWSNMRTRLYLSETSLWRLRAFLEAMGVSVPKKKVSLKFDKYHGKELGISVVDGEPYEGKVSSEIGDFIDLETLEGGDEEDEDDEDEEDEDEDDDEDEDEDDEELEVDDDDDL